MILLLSDDLMDASKTIGHSRAAGKTVLQCRSIAMLMEQLKKPDVEKCIIDLQFPKLDLVELMQARPEGVAMIGYGSHVDAKRLGEARTLGFDEVMPRSKYFAMTV